MTIDSIKTPEDILEFMIENIFYGWIDINNEEHYASMKDFRKLYRTATIEETLKYGLGTCIDQVYLMKHLLDKIYIPNKMFCTRVYEGKDFNNLEEEEHMHCFILYYLNDKVYQLEHPNVDRIGIYKFNSEEAIYRFAKKIRRMGIDDKLKELGAEEGDQVRILDFYFDYRD